jgi:hypothetical protein
MDNKLREEILTMLDALLTVEIEATTEGGTDYGREYTVTAVTVRLFLGDKEISSSQATF